MKSSNIFVRDLMAYVCNYKMFSFDQKYGKVGARVNPRFLSPGKLRFDAPLNMKKRKKALRRLQMNDASNSTKRKQQSWTR